MDSGRIIRVYPGSLAEELGLVPGDRIAEINGEKIRDIIDVSFALADEEAEILVEHEDGESELIAFEKDYDEELGVEFDSAVFDKIRSCGNKCCFCFVDQCAPGMRESLYIKDDDYRLSFLYGNFITMTNMGAEDFRRVMKYHLSPLFVSVHATNMELRASMLGTPRGAELMRQLDALADSGAEYHAQVVLCPGLNDGAELSRTIRDMMARRPFALSLAIVPVGLTKFHRNGLTAFDSAGARRVIDEVRPFQLAAREETGEGFVYLADEFYLMAGEELPAAEEYDGFPQLDNGIGLTRNFIEDWRASVTPAGGYGEPLTLGVVCGTAAYPVITRLVSELSLENLTVRVIPIENRLFGSSVNVSGLLAGADIADAVEGAGLSGLIVPKSAIRTGENVFLDDMTAQELSMRAGVPLAAASGGGALFTLLAHWRGGGEFSESLYAWQSNAAYIK